MFRCFVCPMTGLAAFLAMLNPGVAAAQMIELDTLGGNVCTAANTNDSGAVIGTCRDTEGDIVAAYWAPGIATPVPLAPLEADGPCTVYDINNAGIAAGDCEQGATGEKFPVRWTTSLPGSPPQRLNPMLSHAKAVAWVINHAGVVGGASIEAGGGARAVIWKAGSATATSLPELGLLPPLAPSSTECQVSDLTDSASPIVVGTCELRDGGSVAVRWDPGLLGYGATELPRLNGGSNCVATTVSTTKFIAGTCENSVGDTVAVRWAPSGASPIYLGDLDVVGVSRQQLAVVDMNEAGVIVGNYINDDGFGRAFVWSPTGGPAAEEGLDIGSLGGYWTRAIDIADNGAITGIGQNATGVSRALRWTPTTDLQDLGTLGGFTSQAAALSDSGLWLVGASQVVAGHKHAFIVGPTKARVRTKGAKNGDGNGGSDITTGDIELCYIKNGGYGKKIYNCSGGIY